MILTPLRVISWLLALIVVGVPVAAVAFFLLAVAGSPGPCDSEERPIVFLPELAVSFQQKWDLYNAALDGGQVSTIVFDEGEVTSRARLWAEENDAPVEDLLICFHPEGGAASGKVDVPFFPGDVDVLVEGTLDLRGEHPEPEIEEIRVGSLPGPLADLVKGFINSLVDEETEKIDLGHDYGVTFGEGEVTISGQP